MERMRARSSRRSVSSWVSPGPRRPIPPFCRSRWVQPRTRRVLMCCSWASSTCSLPSWVRARWAKMSRIRPVRSSTRHSSSRSRLRSWLGLRAWLNMTISASLARTLAAISSSLPLPTNVRGCGAARAPMIYETGSPPADRTSSSNSRGSSRWASLTRSRCTRTARSPESGRSKNNDYLFAAAAYRDGRPGRPFDAGVTCRPHRPAGFAAAAARPGRAPPWIWRACTPSG